MTRWPAAMREMSQPRQRAFKRGAIAAQHGRRRDSNPFSGRERRRHLDLTSWAELSGAWLAGFDYVNANRLPQLTLEGGGRRELVTS